jgi:hypothetical protein
LQDFSVNNLVDDLFGTDFECIIQAASKNQQKQNARECCSEVGGELYDEPGHCIFRDVFQNPRDEWRDCALQTRGTDFAECYYREKREVDDSLSSRRRNQRDSQRGDRDRSRSGSRKDRDNSRDRDSRRGDRDDRSQRILNLDGDDRRQDRIVCQIEKDQNRDESREVTRKCCNQIRGRLESRDREVRSFWPLQYASLTIYCSALSMRIKMLRDSTSVFKRKISKMATLSAISAAEMSSNRQITSGHLRFPVKMKAWRAQKLFGISQQKKTRHVPL